jgi:hypothetical protein
MTMAEREDIKAQRAQSKHGARPMKPSSWLESFHHHRRQMVWRLISQDALPIFIVPADY